MTGTEQKQTVMISSNLKIFDRGEKGNFNEMLFGCHVKEPLVISVGKSPLSFSFGTGGGFKDISKAEGVLSLNI